jgi:hypothetical protein
VNERLARAIVIGRRKLKGWREEDHAGEKALFEMFGIEAD